MRTTLTVLMLLALHATAQAAPPKDVVPATDPAESNPPSLVESVMAQRPRLLFGPKDIPKLRAFAKGDGKRFFEQLVEYRAACRPPAKPDFLTNATNGQRIGLWRMPTVALHYVITGDKRSLADAVGYMKLLLTLPHWETTSERDSGMSSANVMIGAALAYDWLYADLEPDFRGQFRDKLIRMARAQYYGGHLNRNKATGYWQGDPANNHRWHRDAGMVLATLAAWDNRESEQWLLARCFDEMAYVNKWLPADGTSHEGPSYLIFGAAHLTLANQAADRCFGTRYLAGDFFRNAPLFRLHTVTPGLAESFNFGDSGGMGNYSNFFYKCVAEHRLADATDGLAKLAERHPKAWWLGWMSLLWNGPDQPAGDLDKLPTTAFFADLGLAVIRDKWTADGTAVMFKCGPFGGYRLNEYRNANGFKYINVAHDDPDANSFTLFAGGLFLAETDRYSKHKQSANHNTILVNGIGQTVAGRDEGGVWSQPGRGDMTTMAVVTAFKDAGDVVIVEGEAAGSYPAIRGKRPALERFRRTLIWVKGKYVLVLDDIRAGEPVEIAWLLQSPKLTAAEGRGRYVLSKGDARCPFFVRSTGTTRSAVVASPADNHGKPLGWQQLRVTAKTDSLRVVSLYDPWHTGAGVTFKPAGPDSAAVIVAGRDFEDTWIWQSPAGRFDPSKLTCKRDGKALVELVPADAPPRHRAAP